MMVRHLSPEMLRPGLAWRAFSILVVSFFLVMDDLAVPIPGVFAMPYHPGLMLCCFGLLGVLDQEARLLVAMSPRPTPEAGASPTVGVRGLRPLLGTRGGIIVTWPRLMPA
jgi:hypothetical protein